MSAGGDIGRLASRKGLGSGDSYRVLLIDDPRHTEKLGMRTIIYIWMPLLPLKG